MNIVTSNTVGINLSIEEVKDNIYDYLDNAWNNDVDMYGRVYKNLKNNRFIPEYYKGENEYEEVLIDDQKAATVIFLVDDSDDETEDEMVFTGKVKIVFMMNLEKAYTLSNRSDERAHKDAIEALSSISFFTGIKINGIVRGMKNVFKGLDTNQIKYADIHPLHCFAVNIDLDYYLTSKCN